MIVGFICDTIKDFFLMTQKLKVKEICIFICKIGTSYLNKIKSIKNERHNI